MGDQAELNPYQTPGANLERPEAPLGLRTRTARRLLVVYAVTAAISVASDVFSYVYLGDNQLTAEVVEAPTWADAIIKHSKLMAFDADFLQSFRAMSLDQIKEQFFNTDSLIDVILVCGDREGGVYQEILS